MHRSIRFRDLSAVFAVVTFGLAHPHVVTAEDRDAGPAMATSRDPDTMTTGSRDPDELVTGSRDPDSMTAKSKNPDDMVTGSRDPDDLLTTSKDPDDMVGESTRLGDLREARDDAELATTKQRVQTFAPDSAEGSGGGSWEGKLATAKARLDRAHRDAEASNQAYTRAMTSNQPRGQARAEIVAKRDAAQAEVADAEKALAALADSARRAGVNPMMIEGLTGSR